MKYLIRMNRGPRPTMHVWDGKDTLCGLVGTGGLDMDNYRIEAEQEENAGSATVFGPLFVAHVLQVPALSGGSGSSRLATLDDKVREGHCKVEGATRGRVCTWGVRSQQPGRAPTLRRSRRRDQTGV